ncbi:MAG TPA: hypothetical protein VHC69_09200 [Polyangiaceae bacterium]|nr:hypothetical protein [Polyangiaceae bacterium]
MKDGTPLVCDSLQRACTTFKAQSAGLCDPCVTDAECVPGELCVLDTVGSGANLKNVGYFCHWKQGDTANGAPSDCTATGTPYVKVVSNATSIDGVKADVCVLRVSSCPANADFSSKNCAPTGTPDDKLCAFSPPIDAKCAQFGPTSYRCTMTCLSSDDCRNGSICTTAVNPPVCSL